MRLLGLTIIIITFTVSCTQQKDITPENWISKPLIDWPAFSLTNEISIGDTTFSNLANSFLVDHRLNRFH